MASEDPTGYCQCGCGERTKIATRTRSARGDCKGQPMRFLLYHESRVRKVKPQQACQCGCGNPANPGRQFLQGHNGHLPRQNRNRPTLPMLFWKYVSPITRATDCWFWIGDTVGNGYGKVNFFYKSYRAHRIAWALAHGPIPDGLCVLHKCDTPACVNPHHMRLGTHAENIADKMQKSRQAKGATVGTSTLNEDIVRAIRADTRDAREIARKYGITHGHVHTIKRRALWKHVV